MYTRTMVSAWAQHHSHIANTLLGVYELVSEVIRDTGTNWPASLESSHCSPPQEGMRVWRASQEDWSVSGGL